MDPGKSRRSLDVASTMMLLELELRAVAARYLPRVIAIDDDPITVFEERGGARLSDETAEKMRREIESVLAFHLPGGTTFDIGVKLIAGDQEIERHIVGTMPVTEIEMEITRPVDDLLPTADGGFRRRGDDRLTEAHAHVNETIGRYGRHSTTSCPPNTRAMCPYHDVLTAEQT
jgi:hypothetical protein